MFKFKLKSVFQTSYRSPLVDIKDDNDVEFLLCEDRVIPQVGVTRVKKVDQSPRGADVHDVLPPVPLTHVKPTHFASASKEIGKGCPTYYGDDQALSHFDQESSDGGSNHDFQPNMEQDSGLDSEVRQKQQCGKCEESGHNRLRCKNLVLPENSSPRPPVTPSEPRQRKCRTCGVARHNHQRCPNWEPPTSNENQKDC
ncbi:hypothetical protein Q3G72_014669 [Acer saccharum]|nr:hypothetical protein Q3G72_014669 [Acer saccharum]